MNCQTICHGHVSVHRELLVSVFIIKIFCSFYKTINIVELQYFKLLEWWFFTLFREK